MHADSEDQEASLQVRHDDSDQERQGRFEERLESAGRGEKLTDPNLDRRPVQHPPRWRPKQRNLWHDQHEVGEVLQLGEFAEEQTLTISEAALVFNAIWDKRKKHGSSQVNRRDTANQTMIDNTRKYFDNFARYTRKETVEAADRLLGQYPQLVQFERAQLGSLGCVTADEAKTLIPSLQAKFDDDVLQDLLDELDKLRDANGAKK